MQDAKEIHSPFQQSHDWHAFQWHPSTDQVLSQEVSSHFKSKN
jgi:hypothetical protein